VLIIIFLILLIRAYRKDTIESPMEAPKSFTVASALTELIPKEVRAFATELSQKSGVEVNALNPTPEVKTGGSKKKTTRSSREDQCRAIFERLFGSKFPTKRPDFLRNPKTNRNLELDGYNENLGLAFEHQGEHHVVFPNTFHKTREDFDNQQRRDKFKAEKCRERGITLLDIPHSVPAAQLEAYISKKLQKFGYVV
jgi:hypothetical protein